jgi:hypothetical protein
MSRPPLPPQGNPWQTRPGPGRQDDCYLWEICPPTPARPLYQLASLKGCAQDEKKPRIITCSQQAYHLLEKSPNQHMRIVS